MGTEKLCRATLLSAININCELWTSCILRSFQLEYFLLQGINLFLQGVTLILQGAHLLLKEQSPPHWVHLLYGIEYISSSYGKKNNGTSYWPLLDHGAEVEIQQLWKIILPIRGICDAQGPPTELEDKFNSLLLLNDGSKQGKTFANTKHNIFVKLLILNRIFCVCNLFPFVLAGRLTYWVSWEMKNVFCFFHQ